MFILYLLTCIVVVRCIISCDVVAGQYSQYIMKTVIVQISKNKFMLSYMKQKYFGDVLFCSFIL